ncbi:LysR family transcriptional regulator [Alkalilimnicola ehrlichii]|uniref:LysR family transcriptional regulator n=1 Tax=Alkalilimnicola ehrlichii TaxID=351052 RepID=UPI001C6EE421|nr:LysR family transcriptional regulator [Alkalilimnicola ehrlichii]
MSRNIRAGEFAELRAFVAVAEARSFRRAALELGLDPSTLSHAVRALEKRLGTRLLHRTTRSVAPTEAGERLLARLSPALSSLESALEDALVPGGTPSGTVRLVAPRLAIQTLIAPIIEGLARDYPHVTLDVITDEQPGDIVRSGFDLAIKLGETIERDMVSIPLMPRFTTAVVGSPAYFAEHPPPTTPHDLARHRCIGCHSGPNGSLYRWEFEKDGTAVVMDVTGPLSTDDPDLMMSAALAGIGLWHGVEELARQAIVEGRLIRVLADWSPNYPGFHLCYAAGVALAPAARAVVDSLKAETRNAQH